VLAIVNQHANAIDARLPAGPMTLVKLDSTFGKLSVAEGELSGYAQYPGSDCLNGAVLKVADGHKLMRTLTSHHYLLTTGHNLTGLLSVARVFDLEVETI
jgi:L-fucose isomerase-like protein